MPFAPMNVLLERALAPKSSLTLPYPEGKNEGHFFGGVNHTLSINGSFFRSPRDFTLLTQSDGAIFTWHGTFMLPAGTLLNLQAEIPGGDFYFDQKIGVTVLGMVHSPLFMVNLSSPAAEDQRYWLEPTAIGSSQPLTLAHTQVATPRNVVIHSDSDNSRTTFRIEGEDLYHRGMVEEIAGPASGKSEGKKSFAQIHRIVASGACQGKLSIGTGNRFGLPVFLPAPGYLFREIIHGESVTGGTIIAGATAPPTATTGDRRGTYTPPAHITPDGRQSIHLLLSLLAPGNIGIPDFTG